MESQTPPAKAKPDITVRSLLETDLAAADRVMRLAFGTFFGAPDPAAAFGDVRFLQHRWKADPSAAFAAEANQEVVGSNIAVHWGSVGSFGPLTVRPDYWDSGVGSRLMEPVMACFDRWHTRHVGLFTFANSPKHIGLYQKYGFYPRFLTAIMNKAVGQTTYDFDWTRYSETLPDERAPVLKAVCQLTDTLYEGLDVTSEMELVTSQGLGDTVLVWEDGQLAGLAICHMGAGTEAGSDACYVKFGAARPGAHVARDFGQLLCACEALAAAQKLSRLVAGMNLARQEAYQMMMGHGFRIGFTGVAMEMPNSADYNRRDAYVMDDWR